MRPLLRRRHLHACPSRAPRRAASSAVESYGPAVRDLAPQPRATPRLADMRRPHRRRRRQRQLDCLAPTPTPSSSTRPAPASRARRRRGSSPISPARAVAYVDAATPPRSPATSPASEEAWGVPTSSSDHAGRPIPPDLPRGERHYPAEALGNTLHKACAKPKAEAGQRAFCPSVDASGGRLVWPM